jgi:site-specific DNA-methyltransferase (adenine-specific)
MHFTNIDADGRAYRDRVVGNKTYRYYADEGRALGSVWTDCPSMAANTPLRSETTGYPTQKPLKLLDRIIRATSHVGSLVVDPFCGSGTTLVAAATADRRFAGCDVGDLAIATTKKRLEASGVQYRAGGARRTW